MQEHLLDKVKALGVIPVPQGRFISEIGDGMKARLGCIEPQMPTGNGHFSIEESLFRGQVTDRWSTERLFSVFTTWSTSGRLQENRSFLKRRFRPRSDRCVHRRSAYAAFEERVKGTISPGKLADFVVLGEDPLTIDKDGIGQISVDATIVGGNVAHDLLGIAN